jgi:hypothetical protein
LPNPKAATAARLGRGHRIRCRFYGGIVAAAHNAISQFFLFDRFQIALLPDWNTIILMGKVGIIPVGVRPFL